MPRYTVTIEDKEFDIVLEYHADRLEAVVNGKPRKIAVHKLGDTRSLLLVDNHSHEVDVRAAGTNGLRTVFMQGMEIPVTVENYSLAQMRKTAGISAGPSIEKMFRAPMPGLVMQIKVEPGQQVKAGDPVVVIEAMKMENILKAKGPAKVKAIHVSQGQSVEKGDKLVEFE